MRLTGIPLLILTLLCSLPTSVGAATLTLGVGAPGALTFTYEGTLPAAKTQQLTCTGGTALVTLTVDPLQPAPWLVVPSSATAPGGQMPSKL